MEIDRLLYQVAIGDETAFHKLYNMTSGAVYGFALSIVKNPHDAEDVAQDTYISVYQAVHTYESHGKPMAWILRIARNHALLKLRERGKHHAFSFDEVEEWLVGQEQLGTEDKIVLENAMKILTDEERQIIVLHSTAGLRHREIAKLLDIKLSTVLSKYHRALKKMKAAIKEV